MTAEIIYLNDMTLKDLSHNIRTPLTGILGMANILAKQKLAPEQKCCVSDIIEAGDHLLKLANLISTKARVIARCNAPNSQELRNILNGLPHK